MARTENHRPGNGRTTPPPAPTARPADRPPNDAAPESLDKVRDILFGGQMRAVESRLQGLEERLMREQATMRTDFSKQLADVDASAKREAQSLGEKLVAEKNQAHRGAHDAVVGAEGSPPLAREASREARRAHRHG